MGDVVYRQCDNAPHIIREHRYFLADGSDESEERLTKETNVLTIKHVTEKHIKLVKERMRRALEEHVAELRRNEAFLAVLKSRNYDCDRSSSHDPKREPISLATPQPTDNAPSPTQLASPPHEYP